ncbi:hypothetical protein VIBNISOn1_p0158 [Vibrio nigripulchritudo SOn1]|uniref:Uncharacterized protein n=1 Tax=Vibrio nigripulchritudo SOn1 TaxID=1238450 RepID=A0AAV2VZX6_9VIBR|nr:hypothetical protein VIBNISOn1_p0158 [Vibrio nigripulchritudo SOn1]
MLADSSEQTAVMLLQSSKIYLDALCVLLHQSKFVPDLNA